MKKLFVFLNCIVVIALSPLLALLMLLSGSQHSTKKHELISRIKSLYGLQKNIILVYSNNPRWKEYIEKNIVSPVQARVVLINIDEANFEGNDIFAQIMELFLGVRMAGGKIIDGKEYCPAVIFPDFDKKAFEVLPLYKAFLKHHAGNSHQIQKFETTLMKKIHFNHQLATNNPQQQTISYQ